MLLGVAEEMWREQAGESGEGELECAEAETLMVSGVSAGSIEEDHPVHRSTAVAGMCG